MPSDDINCNINKNYDPKIIQTVAIWDNYKNSLVI